MHFGFARFIFQNEMKDTNDESKRCTEKFSKSKKNIYGIRGKLTFGRK